jgi:tetratricopeptide (TPR) repeat protein
MRRRRFAGLALIAGLASGCAGPVGPGHPTRLDPDRRLGELLDRWDALRAAGAGCDADPHRGPVADCAELQHEVERLTVEFPRHVPSLHAAAVLSEAAGEHQKARSYLDALFAATPAHPEAAMLRSRLATAEGNVPFASRLLAEQVRLTPDHSGLREAQAGVLYLEGRFEEALEALRVAERLGAPAWRVAYHRGLIAEARRDPVAAAAHYRRALEENPAFRPARARLAGVESEWRPRGPRGRPGSSEGG